jgi:hypothetical protein
LRDAGSDATEGEGQTMTYDRAIRALLNGKAIARPGCKFIRLRDLHYQGEVYQHIAGPSGNEVPTIYTSIEQLLADDWKCGTYDSSTRQVTWDDVVYDGHEKPIDRFEDIAEQLLDNLTKKAIKL